MVKNPPANAGDIRDAGLIPGSGKYPKEGNGQPTPSLAWEAPWTEEPGRPQSTGSERDGHGLATKELCQTQKFLSHLPLLRNLPKEMLQQNKEANQEDKDPGKKGS